MKYNAGEIIWNESAVYIWYTTARSAYGVWQGMQFVCVWLLWIWLLWNSIHKISEIFRKIALTGWSVDMLHGNDFKSIFSKKLVYKKLAMFFLHRKLHSDIEMWETIFLHCWGIINNESWILKQLIENPNVPIDIFFGYHVMKN